MYCESCKHCARLKHVVVLPCSNSMVYAIVFPNKAAYEEAKEKIISFRKQSPKSVPDDYKNLLILRGGYYPLNLTTGVVEQLDRPAAVLPKDSYHSEFFQ